MTNETEVPGFALSWGHANGLVELRRPVIAADAGALIQRQAIIETLQAYGWSIDERRWEVLGDILTEDFVFRGDIAGAAHLDELDSREGYLDWLKAYTGTLEAQLRHTFSNVLVTEQEDASATALAYVVLLSVTPEGARVASTAFYRASLRREDGTWRIARLYTGFDAAF